MIGILEGNGSRKIKNREYLVYILIILNPGRPPKLPFEQQIELRDFIDSSEDYYSIEDARELDSKKI